MFDDDLDPKTKKPAIKNLGPLSIDELETYIQRMEDEIIRTRAEIEKKKAHQQAAASIFKS